MIACTAPLTIEFKTESDDDGGGDYVDDGGGGDYDDDGGGGDCQNYRSYLHFLVLHPVQLHLCDCHH